MELASGETGVAPGQACVFYDGEGADARVLGGGFIERCERDEAAEAMLRSIAEDGKASRPSPAANYSAASAVLSSR